MKDVCSLMWLALIGLFRSRASLQAEILTLRHQLNVLRRKSPQRITFTSIDRLAKRPMASRICEWDGLVFDQLGRDDRVPLVEERLAEPAGMGDEVLHVPDDA